MSNVVYVKKTPALELSVEAFYLSAETMPPPTDLSSTGYWFCAIFAQ